MAGVATIGRSKESFHMRRLLCLFGVVLCGAYGAHAQQAGPKPLRLAIAGMTHGHVHWILGRPDRGDVQIVGIYETNRELVDRYAKRYGFRADIVFDDLGKMLDAVKPEAVAAFGPTSDHLRVVEACAPRRVHVMVEKPLALDHEQALRMQALAKEHSVHVLTNYETTWYPSTNAAFDLARRGQVTGPVRKVIVRDGHPGPKEIGVEAEFLEWLTDPKRNGGGALMDFGCYGANLATRLMGGAQPLTVTAVTQQVKPEIYRAVEDEATIVLAYRDAQAIIEASWNWPFSRKDMEVYGRTGYVRALDARNMRVRAAGDAEERAVVLEPRSAPYDDPFAFLAVVVRGDVAVPDEDLSSLANNVVVMRILDAARESARTGRTVTLGPAGR
jgi:predicted dehydrogenase